MQPIFSFLVLSLVVCLTACGPMGPMPGGTLDGESTAVPESWAASDAVDVITLETNPDDPYSVNIWGVAIDPYLYVGASKPESTWAMNIAKDERVRVRIGKLIYELNASKVEDSDVQNSVREAYIRKYELDPEDEDFGGTILFRLEPR